MTALNLIFQQMNNPQHMMDGWGGSFGMGFMIFFWLLILILMGTLIWFLIRKGSDSTYKPDDKTPLEILKKRYAHGEIDKEQFHRMKKELTE